MALRRVFLDIFPKLFFKSQDYPFLILCAAPSLNVATYSKIYIVSLTITLSYPILRTIPLMHEKNALREVSLQWVGKFLLKSIIALYLRMGNSPEQI